MPLPPQEENIQDDSDKPLINIKTGNKKVDATLSGFLAW
jgi:membrane protein